MEKAKKKEAKKIAAAPYRGYKIYKKGKFYYSDDWSGIGFYPKAALHEAIDKHLPGGVVFKRK